MLYLSNHYFSCLLKKLFIVPCWIQIMKEPCDAIVFTHKKSVHYHKRWKIKKRERDLGDFLKLCSWYGSYDSYKPGVTLLVQTEFRAVVFLNVRDYWRWGLKVACIEVRDINNYAYCQNSIRSRLWPQQNAYVTNWERDDLIKNSRKYVVPQRLSYQDFHWLS